MAKEWMIEALGEDRLLLPGLIAQALAANDRVKYLLTLLQTACAATDGAGGASLQEERLACGIEDPSLDNVVANSLREDSDHYRVPGAEALTQRAIDAVRTMLVPLDAAGVPEADGLRARLADVAGGVWAQRDVISADDITRLTAGPRSNTDSLHLVVIDAHRALNALERQIATESIDGARVHGLDPADRKLVAAFMRGIHSTAKLKFDHPGLGTLATRTGPALVLQNDLGTTDAHVVVIRVTGRVVTITYTDVHLQRLLFFQRLLSVWPVSWEDTRSHSEATIEGGLYHLASARLEARDDQELLRFLEDVGSSLVFVIDWNRARKRLRRLVGRRAAIGLLRWAAAERYGHIAFLRAGADGLVYDALEFAGGRTVHAGESLQDVLGSDAAERYLRAVLRICSEGLLADKPVSLVQDEVRAELTGYLRSAHEELYAIVLRHAELSVEIAEAASDALQYRIAGAEDRCSAAASRAQRDEREADALVTDARESAARSADMEALLALVEAADDIADSVEEAAFYATLLPAGQPTSAVREHVTRIARLVLAAARDYLRAAQLSVELRRGGPRGEMDAFLTAAHRVIELERETDEAQRAVHQALVADAERSQIGQFVIVELTRSFEEAADALMHASHLLREHALGRVVRSEASARRPAEPPPAADRVIAPTASDEHVYLIDGSATTIPDPMTIGAKAHGLARIARAGLRVPEAAVLKTSLSRGGPSGATTDVRLEEVVRVAVEALESRTGLQLGSRRRPLLLSVRSGAPVSMPGMLETVLNVGASDASVGGIIMLSGNPGLAWDCYRRLIESYATVVHGCAHEPFDEALARGLTSAGVDTPRELSARELERLAGRYRQCFSELTGSDFPQDPDEQVIAAVRAVLASWNGAKAREYRQLHGISDAVGTAVILQRMVFGNSGGVSGAGVGFTRDPALGRRQLYLDFLFDAQGEDVVAGRRTVDGASEFAAIAPDLLDEVDRICRRLEAEFGDAQEFELTVEDGTVFLLQARTAKRTPWAALQIATDQVREGLITPQAARARVDELDLAAIRRVHVDPGSGAQPLAQGIPASVGVAIGPIALDREAAERAAAGGSPPVLVRADTVTEDVASVSVSAGVLTRAGGRTSHAAVVARELGKPCLVACRTLELDAASRTVSIGGQTFREGEVICIDAEAGLVFAGSPAVIEERPVRQLAEAASWGGTHTPLIPATT